MTPVERAEKIRELYDEGFSRNEIALNFGIEFGKRLSKGMISTDLKITSDGYSFLLEKMRLGIIPYRIAKLLVFLEPGDSESYLSEYLKNGWSHSKLEKEIKERKIKFVNYDIEKEAQNLLFKTKGVRSEIGNKKIVIKYRNIKDLSEIFKKLDIQEE